MLKNCEGVARKEIQKGRKEEQFFSSLVLKSKREGGSLSFLKGEFPDLREEGAKQRERRKERIKVFVSLSSKGGCFLWGEELGSKERGQKSVASARSGKEKKKRKKGSIRCVRREGCEAVSFLFCVSSSKKIE